MQTPRKAGTAQKESTAKSMATSTRIGANSKRLGSTRLGTRGQPEESRAAILKAAVGEFAEHGVAGARTDAIASQTFAIGADASRSGHTFCCGFLLRRPGLPGRLPVSRSPN